MQVQRIFLALGIFGLVALAAGAVAVLAASSVWITSAATSEGSLYPGSKFSAGDRPRSVAVAHPNRDGASDILGDVNCDGAVDIRDALLIFQLHEGLVASLDCIKNSDVDGDGFISTIDADLILRALAGLIDLPLNQIRQHTSAADRTSANCASCQPSGGLAGLPGPSIEIGNVGPGPVDLVVAEMPPPGLGGWVIDITYDPLAVSLVDCSAVGSVVCNARFSGNTARVVGVDVWGLEGSGTLATLDFGCITGGTSPLTLVVQQLVDAAVGDPQDVFAQVVNGSVNCATPTPCPPGGCPTPTITPMSPTGPTVSVGSVSLDVGEQGSVELRTLNIGAPGLTAWAIDIIYDPAVTSVLACTPTAETGVICAFNADTIRHSGVSPYGLEGDTTLASITFSCHSRGASALTLSLEVFVDATVGDPQPIDAATENGSVTCGPLEPTPSITPTPTATATNTSTVTPSTTPTPTPTQAPTGDANCDGAVNSIDATLMLQLDAGLVASLACEGNGDVNDDGVVNSIDATLILQFDAGLLPSLPT